MTKLPSLDIYARGVATALSAAQGNAASALAGLLNGDLVKPKNFRPVRPQETGTTLGTQRSGSDRTADLTGHERFQVAVNYLAVMAKIQASISDMKAKVNALDSKQVQEMAEVDKAELSKKLGASYEMIQKQTGDTHAKQLAAVMRGDVPTLDSLIKPLFAVLATVHPFSVSDGLTLNSIMIAINALVISTMTLGHKSLFDLNSTAARDPAVTATTNMAIGAMMAIASIGTAAGTGISVAAKGAELAMKLSSSLSPKVAPEVMRRSSRHVLRSTVSASAQALTPTIVAMLLPTTMKAAATAMPEDEEAQQSKACSLTVLAMLLSLMGTRVGSGTVSQDRGAARTTVTVAKGASNPQIPKDAVGSFVEKMKELMLDPEFSVKSSHASNMSKVSGTLTVFSAVAQVSCGILGLIQARQHSDAAESEAIQGLLDILGALQSEPGKVKQDILNDLEQAWDEVLNDQHKAHDNMYHSASGWLSSGLA